MNPKRKRLHIWIFCGCGDVSEVIGTSRLTGIVCSYYRTLHSSADCLVITLERREPL